MMPSHSEAEAGPTIVAANDWSLGIEERPDMTATQWQSESLRPLNVFFK